MPSIIEKLATKFGFIPEIPEEQGRHGMAQSGQAGIAYDEFPLNAFPPMDQWDHWEELDPQAWPERKMKQYGLVPTICFNCESGCGLLAYVDKDTREIKKLEGNPMHPGSRGRNCAKGPATINQVEDTDRILYPLRRKGERGSGEWERISWETALKEIAGKITDSFDRERQNNVVYHVGRPGHEKYMNRVLNAWGIDGHNSHTTICSAGARVGYGLWYKYDRPSPDHANAKLILLVSAHLESGHYFNPHAQRILEGMMKGAKLVVLDPRLSNTASMADVWMPTQPGSEAALFLAIARLMLINKTFVEDQFKDWTNWDHFMSVEHADKPQTFEAFCDVLLEEWAEWTPERAAKETGCPLEQVMELYELVANCDGKLASHTWRSASIGNLGGWQVSRTLHLLCVMTGSVGAEGGTLPNAWSKFSPTFFDNPPSHKFWNTINMPDEWSVAPYEMSQCLPHILKEREEKLDVYFTRVFNPVWTYPDGFSWIEMLSNHDRVGCHVAMTPTWNETAFYADYVLPMGHAPERHDLVSYATDSAMWLGFRQPVQRVQAEREGQKVHRTYETNPGEVWEEDEFWIDLSWAMDPEGKRGIRKHFESPNDPTRPVSMDEYYGHIFENVPSLVEAAKKEDRTPLEYMKRHGAFEVAAKNYHKHRTPLTEAELAGTSVDERGRVVKDGKVVGVMDGDTAVMGFPTPSKKMEIWSESMKEHGWADQTLPGFIKSHVHPDNIDRDNGEFCLVPTFRLPTLIHSRTGAAKWLNEISNTNPLWMHPSDMKRLGIKNGHIVRVNTDIGHFVDRVWATEAIKPGTCACSHHMGRWRRKQDPGNSRWSGSVVDVEKIGATTWRTRKIGGVTPFKSDDPDSQRIFWKDGGVHQNAAAPIHPDPISGANCWLQKVRIEKAHAGDLYGDVVACTDKAHAVYQEWKAMCRPVEDGKLRRIGWMTRPFAPVKDAWIKGNAPGEMRAQESAE